MDSLTVLFAASILFSCVICKDSKEPWVMVREMGYTGYQIKSVEKIIDSENQTYISRIKAPITTEIEKLPGWYGMAEMKQVSQVNDGSAIYEAKAFTRLDTYMLPPVLLTSGTESLDLDFSPFASREDKQLDFKFNDCQLQVERRDQTGSTTYKLTVRGCVCRRTFKGSVRKMTASGFEETAGISAAYLFPSHVYSGSNKDDQFSAIFINRTALVKDGVQINKLKFVIEREQDDLDLDFIDRSKYEYSLT